MTPRSPQLVPSYPAPSWEALLSALSDLRSIATEFQVDIVDGQFVSATSWPYTTSDPIAALSELKPWSSEYVLEIDCMIERPESLLDTFAGLGISRMVVHHGSTTALDAIISHGKEHGYIVGYAFTNDVSVSDIRAEIDRCAYVQVMGIATVGAQGQAFDERTIETVEQLRELYPDREIAIDGSVNETTIPTLLAAGANRLCPGSAIIAADDRSAAFRHLQALV